MRMRIHSNREQTLKTKKSDKSNDKEKHNMYSQTEHEEQLLCLVKFVAFDNTVIFNREK